MTPTDPTRTFDSDPHGPTADAPAPDSGLDAGLAAAFGSDDTAGATADFAGKDEHVGAILGGKYK